MISHKRILKNIAKNNRLDSDELLLVLWDSGKRFDYLKNENSVVRDKDLSKVKDIIAIKLKIKDSTDLTNFQPRQIKVITRDHDFSAIGKIVSPMNYITKDEILKIYEELVTDFIGFEDPIEPAGVKDEDLLESAIFHPTTSYDYDYKYPTAETAGAALMYALTHNHAFHNGNKRTAMVAMLVFLDRHNIFLTCDEDDLFKVSLKLADHKLVDEIYLYMDSEIDELACWIHDNSKIFKKGERPITLKKLRQILTHFDCTILDNGKVERTINTSGFLGLSKKKTLTSKRTIEDSISGGKEIDKGLIKSLREDLELNTVGSIDSEMFYEMDSFTTSDFINKYKNLLKRLAKV